MSSEAPAQATVVGRQRWLTLTRVEDWLLAGWVLVVAPLLIHGSSTTTDPLAAGGLLQGLLRLGAVLAALACIVVRRAPEARADGGGADRSVAGSAAIGPFAGGLLLVAITGGSGVGLSSGGATAFALLAVAVMVVARLAVPPLTTTARRALVTPFVLVAGGLFWSVIDAVAGPTSNGLTGQTTVWTSSTTALGFLLAFSGVYYAMLIFAPRQVAAREGGPLAWLVRYGLFVASVVVGIGWLRVLGS